MSNLGLRDYRQDSHWYTHNFDPDQRQKSQYDHNFCQEFRRDLRPDFRPGSGLHSRWDFYPNFRQDFHQDFCQRFRPDCTDFFRYSLSRDRDFRRGKDFSEHWEKRSAQHNTSQKGFKGRDRQNEEAQGGDFQRPRGSSLRDRDFRRGKNFSEHWEKPAQHNSSHQGWDFKGRGRQNEELAQGCDFQGPGSSLQDRNFKQGQEWRDKVFEQKGPKGSFHRGSSQKRGLSLQKRSMSFKVSVKKTSEAKS